MSETLKSAITTDWTKKSLKKLLSAIKRSVPKQERKSEYAEGLKAVDWMKVAFPPFSPEECQKKWEEILQMMRKTRTLSELIVEARHEFSRPDKKKTAQRVKKRQLAFEDCNGGMLKKKSLKPKQQPLKKRKMVFDYTESEEHIPLKPPTKKSPKPKQQPLKKRKMVFDYTESEEHIPLKPPTNGYHLFCKEQVASMEGVSRNAYVSVWAQRWRQLTDKQKQEYNTRCSQLREVYMVKITQYLEPMDKNQQQQIRKKHGIKRQWVSEEGKFPGEPKRPPLSANAVFFKEQMEPLKEKFPKQKERFKKLSQMWNDLSAREKKHYKIIVAQTVDKYRKELQKWFKTLTPEEQSKYCKHNPSKTSYLVEETKADKHEEKVHRPSDSEDEEMEDSSSEEDENILDNREEDEEDKEEEENDNMFDLY